MIGAVRAIVVKDLRERLRDRSVLLLGILAPLVLAFILDLVFGDLGEGELEVRFGVVDVDQSEVSGELRDGLAAMDGEGGFEVTALGADADPATAVDENELDAVVVVPAGFGADVTSPGANAPQLQVVGDPDRPIQAGVVESVVDGLAADVERTRLVAAVSERLDIASDTVSEATGFELNREQPGGAGLDTGARMMAGMAVMFVFFTVQFGVTTLLNEKENGTLRRLLVAPIPRDSIMAAKGVVSYVLGVVATMVLMVAGTVLMGASWGSWLGVLVLVLAAVLTAVALMAIVAGIANTAEGASAAQAIIAVGLAMLGGSWFPVADEGLIGALSRLTPHYWFLGGLEDLADASSWTVVGAPAAAMVVIAVVAGIPAAYLLRRRLAP